MLLEDLLTTSDALPLSEYTSLLRQAAESGVTVDDARCAEQFASLAKRLGYSAAAVRQDHELMRRCVQLERFDADALAADQRELERVRPPDHAYHKAGGELDRTLLRLKSKLDAAPDSDQAEILAEMEAAREKGRELTRAMRVVEVRVIAALSARDRLSAFRQGHRRLFPADSD